MSIFFNRSSFLTPITFIKRQGVGRSNSINSVPLEFNDNQQDADQINKSLPTNIAQHNAILATIISYISFKFPKYPTNLAYKLLIFSGFINICFFLLYIYLFLTYVVFNTNKTMKPWKTLCLTETDINSHLCLVSVGYFARGIVAIGGVCIGIFSVGQISIGLLFAVGQFAGSCFFTALGQLATGWYVHSAQISLSYWFPISAMF